MRCIDRNKVKFYYSLFLSKENIEDDDGFLTGEYRTRYSSPIEMRASISPATGVVRQEQFGNATDYDKVIITDDIKCPIDENTVLYIEVTPDKPYDYVVKKVAKSLNFVSIAISKVNVDV